MLGKRLALLGHELFESCEVRHHVLASHVLDLFRRGIGDLRVTSRLQQRPEEGTLPR